MAGLERLFSLGFGVLGLALTLGLVTGALKLWRLRSALPKRARNLPRHKVAWEDEASYERLLEGIYREVRQAITDEDRETLEVLAHGPAYDFFKPRLEVLDKREVLQGSVRESWDEATQKLTVTLAVTRWAGGWKRFYEQWTLERRGKGWFVVDARTTRLNH